MIHDVGFLLYDIALFAWFGLDLGTLRSLCFDIFKVVLVVLFILIRDLSPLLFFELLNAFVCFFGLLKKLLLPLF